MGFDENCVIHQELLIRKNQILEKAFELREEYRNFRDTMNEDADEWYNRSYMDLYVRRKDGVVEISWRHNVKQRKYNRKSSTITLKRGKTFRYPQNTLFRYAKEWEKEAVLEIEDKAADLREEVDQINKILRSLKKIKIPVYENGQQREMEVQKMKNEWVK